VLAGHGAGDFVPAAGDVHGLAERDRDRRWISEYAASGWSRSGYSGCGFAACHGSRIGVARRWRSDREIGVVVVGVGAATRFSECRGGVRENRSRSGPFEVRGSAKTDEVGDIGAGAGESGGAAGQRGRGFDQRHFPGCRAHRNGAGVIRSRQLHRPAGTLRLLNEQILSGRDRPVNRSDLPAYSARTRVLNRPALDRYVERPIVVDLDEIVGQSGA